MSAHTPSPSLGAMLVALAAFATGCPSPDPQGKFDGFLDDTKEPRDEFANQKRDMGSTLADINGDFLFAIDTSIAPGLFIQFIATTTLDIAADGSGGTMTITFQPLSLEVGSTTDPREFVGETIFADNIAVSPDGAFEIESLGEVMVTGEANPITGSDIVADLGFGGFIQDDNLYCGTVHGMVISPISAPLEGSTFAAIRVDATDAASLPAAVGACPEDGGGTGGSGGSGGDSGGSTGGGTGATTSG